MHIQTNLIYDIRVYRLAVVFSLILMILSAIFLSPSPHISVENTITSYFTHLFAKNLTLASTHTMGQLKQNITDYQDHLHDIIQKIGYSGTVKGITIHIVDLRPNYARANVIIVAEQSFLYYHQLDVERHFDVQLAKADTGWKIMSAVQEQMRFRNG